VIEKALPVKGAKLPNGKKWKGEYWGVPISSHTIRFSSDQTQLEPIYYWILDFITDMGWSVEKVVDNFRSSPGSGQHNELGMKATRLQEEAMKIFEKLNAIIRTALNLVYDLKEFEMRLKTYDKASSKDKRERYEGMLALKQIWLDTVDIKKQNGSITSLSMQAGFVTLRDLFFLVNNQDELEKQEIVNDQTKRILVPRLDDFLKWVEYSEAELRKRFKIERSYLKAQVESIKLYSSWLKP